MSLILSGPIPLGYKCAHIKSVRTRAFLAPIHSLPHAIRSEISHVFSFAYSQRLVRLGSLTLAVQSFSCLAQASARQIRQPGPTPPNSATFIKASS